ncbi:hypothetical protein QBC37DRAFT_458307 [Rhypophila decipiens]|uniref:Uncharacterized protein n=1 Tax=Rhypophila decipiens TaxID=261697 RepID=A0AAN7AYZ3_9PEZI|nr:hypothetical protein QBC37DRAFT_458307 [Rhypophila decipiens]
MDREKHEDSVEETLNRLSDLYLRGDNDDRNNNDNRNNSNGLNNNDDGNNNPSNHDEFDYDSYLHSDDEQFTEKVSHDPGPEPEPEPTLKCMICSNDPPVSDIFETYCRGPESSGCVYCRGCLQHLHLLSFREEGRFPPSCCGVPIPTLALEHYLGQEIIRNYLARLNEHAIPADK